ncbi:hypothetical protein BDV59DRAFT_199136 [Aspergillus ambiguus]|uniref:SOS response-associated peptidase n=1 Tax=Aspergillus ambiguus TaxID=176160 RepID=UPI003CCD6463
MCGRYAMSVRMPYVRRRLQERGMQVDEAPDDDEVRETYNFAPGYNGAVYRAALPSPAAEHDESEQAEHADKTPPETKASGQVGPIYKLQSMKWGLVPFWTKRQPDYGSLMRTINCRDDSLMEDRGMWTSMKRRKRCVVVCEGFYEWLKKGPGGKEKIPHYIKRKDGDLMYFAGLWDCVSYEGSDDMLYTYTIITTSSNQYLKFLHDRMPVILEPNSDAMKTWLDPSRTTWSKELQSILKPYEGELECYPVPKEVGKVGNNSPDFVIPLKENKGNIANFFANAKKKSEPVLQTEKQQTTAKPGAGVKREYSPEGTDNTGTDDRKKTKTEGDTSSPKRGGLEQTPSKKQSRSATHNLRSPKKTDSAKASHGSQPITKFFGK